MCSNLLPKDFPICVDEAQLTTAPDFAGYPLARNVCKQGEAKTSDPLLSPQSYVPVTDNSHAVRTLLACVARQCFFIKVRNQLRCFVDYEPLMFLSQGTLVLMGTGFSMVHCIVGVASAVGKPVQQIRVYDSFGQVDLETLVGQLKDLIGGVDWALMPELIFACGRFRFSASLKMDLLSNPPATLDEASVILEDWKNFHTTQKNATGSLAKDVNKFLQIEKTGSLEHAFGIRSDLFGLVTHASLLGMPYVFSGPNVHKLVECSIAHVALVDDHAKNVTQHKR